MSTPPEAEPTRGVRLGRYELCAEIAAGGMASVYLARMVGPQGFEKIVAIKVVHPHLARERQFVEMFLDEARLAAAIQHPNVCAVFDFGEADGVQYLVMEHLVGESFFDLTRALAKGRDPELLARAPFIVARLFVDACEGLHAAHELHGADGEPLGLVHRDVTPQNLFVGYDGVVKVLDFGVAKAASQLHQTEAGKIKGKLAYVSPEQLRNLSLDRRSDVFGLGVSLWEGLTLKRLFRRDSDAATLMAVAYDEVAPPSSVRSWLPPELDAIVMQALARNPDERFATARDLGRALSDQLAGDVTRAEVTEFLGRVFGARREERIASLRLAREQRVKELSGVGPVPRAGSSSAPSFSLELSAPASGARVVSGPALGGPALGGPALGGPAPDGYAPDGPAPDDGADEPTRIDADREPIVAKLPLPSAAPRPSTPSRTRVVAGLTLAAAAAVYTTFALLGWRAMNPRSQIVVTPLAAAETTHVEAPGAPPVPPGPSTRDVARTLAVGATPPPATAPTTNTEPTDGMPQADDARLTQEAARAAEPSARRPPRSTGAPGRSRSLRDDAPETEAASSAAPAGTSPPSGTAPTGTAPTDTAPTGTGTGRVRVTTRGGWADVAVDGRRVGRTPQLLTLPRGSHEITLLPFGEGEGHTESVDIEPNDLLSISVTVSE